ncbi:prephenate dehydrogenase [Alteribacter natronophilus]|uniref:prephenate dehydrogenase n=1 Tax=Alteribacter natronophilus TaxID=2583810 RepID=UPI00110ECDA1|nr:prephenate dehydrogenase [Alteribacter natronophilus]TMW73588.1 prephenate dehydrogenase [Alteribacter natronophilus]
MGKRVFIAGLGLIGGSLALAVKKEHPQAQITGFDINNRVVKTALSLDVIDRSCSSLEEGAAEADLIIIAAPVGQTVTLIGELAKLPLKKGAIITDVGSTKKSVCEAAKALNGMQVSFIGGHPMAGSHKTGVEASRLRLFENAYYIFTPYEDEEERTMIRLQNWLKGTKARFIRLTPDTHDFFAGTISHFPHIVAAGLVHELREEGKTEPVLNNLAAGGFRDITRIASASPVMWRDILLSNREVLLSLIDKWQMRMSTVRELIEKRDEDGLFRFFETAKQTRDALPVRKKGAIPSFYDLFVDVPDHPGVISDVTGILAKKEISLTNIRILETREDITGVLRLSFRTEQDLLRAKALLNDHLYDAYEAP